MVVFEKLGWILEICLHFIRDISEEMFRNKIKNRAPRCPVRYILSSNILVTTSSEFTFFHEAIVVSHNEVRLDLLEGIEGNADDNDKASTAEIERNISDFREEFRDNCNESEEDRAWESDSNQDVVDVSCSIFSRENTRDKATVFFHIFSHIDRIKSDSGVEVSEEDNHAHIEDSINCVSRGECSSDEVTDSSIREEGSKGSREHNHGLSEDDRDNACRVNSEGDMSALSAVDFSTDYAFSVLNVNFSNSFSNEDNRSGNEYHNSENNNSDDRIHGISSNHLNHLPEALRVSSYNTGEDDKGDTVSDTFVGNLFTQPHNNHSTSYHSDDSSQSEEDSRIVNNIHTLQEYCYTDSVENAYKNCSIASNLSKFFSSFGPFFSKFFEIGNDTSQ